MSVYSSFQSNWCVVPSVRSLYETAYGVKTHYVTAGEGEPIVLVHGGGPGASGSTGWTNTIPALAKHFRVYALDLIGNGDTDKPLMEYSLQTLVEHVAGFIDALNLKTVRILGNSQGAYVAIKYVLDNPGRVKSAALISTGNVATACGIESAAQTVARSGKLESFDGTRESLRSFMELIVNDKSKLSDELIELRFRNASKPGHKEMLDSLKRYRRLSADNSSFGQARRLRERLLALTIPYCILWGEHDRTAPLDPLGYGMKELLPHVPFHIIEGSGHQVQNDRADECNKILIDHFLAN